MTRLAMSEAELQVLVTDCALANGWWVHHHHDSRRSQAGFPDLVLLRPPEALFVELKSERGVVTKEQKWVLNALAAAGNASYIWRPEHIDHLIRRLGHQPPRDDVYAHLRRTRPR